MFGFKRLVYLVILFFIVLTLSIITLYSVSIYHYQRKILIEDHAEKASGIANAVSALFNSDKEYLESLKKYIVTLQPDEKYNEIQTRITRFKDSVKITYLYIVVVRDGHEIYIIDTICDNWDTYKIGEAEVMGPKNYELATQMFQKGTFIEGHQMTSERYGDLVTAYAPIRDEHGKLIALVGADYRMDDIFQKQNQFIMVTITHSSMLLTIFILIAFLLVNRRIVMPIEQLARTMKTYAEAQDKDDGKNHFVSIRTGDEIEQLANAYNLMVREINQYVEELRKSLALRERSRGELDAALAIQRGILPHEFPPLDDAPNVFVTAMLTPARGVGGDLYDVFVLQHRYLVLIIGDVSGKGVPAALFMAITETLQRTLAKSDTGPDVLANSLNQMLCRGNETAMFVTWWVGFLDMETGVLRYTSAGHNPPILKKADGTVIKVEEVHGPPLAIAPGHVYSESEIHLSEEDILILYTDGVTEAYNLNTSNEQLDYDRTFFGTDRLIECIRNTTEIQPGNGLETIRVAVKDFTGETEQSDDLTLLALRFKMMEYKN